MLGHAMRLCLEIDVARHGRHAAAAMLAALVSAGGARAQDFDEIVNRTA